MTWLKRALLAVLGFFVFIVLLGGLLQWMGYEPEPQTASADAVSSPSARPRVGPNERYVTRADYGDAWPFTVENGTLACVQGSAVLFRAANGTSYGLNGTALSRNYPDSRPIVRQRPIQGEPPAPLARLSETDRRRLFAASVACEDRGDKAADLAGGSVMNQADVASRISDSCKAQLRKTEGLSKSDAEQISIEGIVYGWSPLTPTMMSVGDLIRDGLTLCGR